MAPVLSVHELTLRFSGAAAAVIEGLNLALAPGEFLVIVGGSGVGKSTLLRAMAGLIAPESGRVEVPAPARPGRRRRAIVFQDGRLMPWRRLAANVRFGLEGLGVSRAEATRRVAAALDLTGLSEFADRFPHQLSGGQAQRAGIARALAVEPDILLMDEPFSAVDAITRAGLQTEVTRIWQASGAGVVFVTHDIEEAVLLADRVLVLAGQPAHVALDLPIGASRPRRRGDSALAPLAERIEAAL